MAQSGDKWIYFKHMRETGQIKYPGRQNDFSILSELGIPGNLDKVLRSETADPTLPDDVDFGVIPGPGMSHLASYTESGPTPLIPRRAGHQTSLAFDRTPEYAATPLVPEQVKNLDLKKIDLSEIPGPGQAHLNTQDHLVQNAERRSSANPPQTTTRNNIVRPNEKSTSTRAAKKPLINIDHTENVSGVDIPVIAAEKH